MRKRQKTSPIPYPSIVLLLFFLLVSHYLPGQESILSKPISVSFDTSLFSALSIVEDSTGYYFTYNPQIIPVDRHVNYNSSNNSLTNVLDEIIADSTLAYKVFGNQIAIFQIKETTGKNETGNDIIDKFIPLKGRILDIHNDKSIPFATISVKGKAYGTISNEQGDFTLNIPVSFLDDTLAFSCLGYSVVYRPVMDLIISKIEVRLSSDYIPIQEVVIRKVDPLILIKKALANKKNNYPTKSYNFTGFYRESIVKNNRYIAVSEAVIKGYKSSYKKPFEKDQLCIVKGRKSLDESRADTILVKLKSGLYNSLLLDFVKHGTEFLNEQNFRFYKYKMSDIITSDNRDVYVIDFGPRAGNEEASYKGKIFIEQTTDAFVNAEFSLNQTGIKLAEEYMVLKKPRYLRVKPLNASYFVKYIPYADSLYYLNYLRSTSEFRVRSRKKLFSSTYTIISEMVITDITTQGVSELPSGEKANIRDFFTEQLGRYDPEFWENHVYIEPDKSLAEAFKNFQVEKDKK